MTFVESPLSTRVWRTYKEAGRPFPRLSQDDVIDYMIIEAMVSKNMQAESEAQERAEHQAWMKDQKGFDSLRERAG